MRERTRAPAAPPVATWSETITDRMIAYAPGRMGFFDRLRKMLQGPPHIQGGDDESNAALHEEFGTRDAGSADIRRMESTVGGAVMPGMAGSEAAETAEADLSEEAPPSSES